MDGWLPGTSLLYGQSLECRVCGRLPDPSLYKALGIHQCSKHQEIRGYYEQNSHVLEIVKKGYILQKNL